MIDEQSLIVTYEAWRGEPRGKLKGVSVEAKHGDCIDCGKCVAVCPTGIDIRDGQQLECIGCGLCIDACNTVMPVIGRPKNLIAFDTLANQAAEAAGGKAVYHLIRPRTIIYAAMLLLVAGVMAVGLFTRGTIDVDVLHERSPLFVALSGGNIRNGFTVRILNKSHDPRTFALEVAGLVDYRVSAVGIDATGDRTHPLALPTPPDGVETYRIYVTVSDQTLARNRETHMEGRMQETPIQFEVTAPGGTEHASHASIFIAPPSAQEQQ
jgi:cytochrome c oxidase accessory protein FixG